MKKFLTYSITLLFITMMTAVPALAGNGSNAFLGTNNGIAGSQNHHNTVNSGTIEGGDAVAFGGNAIAFGGKGGAGGDGGDASDVDVDIGDVNVDARTINPEQKDITTVRNEGHGYRGFANPAETAYPGMPSYFGPAVRNGNVRTVKSIIMYKDTFTRSDVIGLLKGVVVDANSTISKVEDEDGTATVKVVLLPPAKYDVNRQCAVINSQATDKKASSVNALAAAINAALDVDADTLFITAEGAGCELNSNGWGVGLAWTTAVINSSENTGSVGSGGLGVTGGTAGYSSLPWIQGIALDLK